MRQILGAHFPDAMYIDVAAFYLGEPLELLCHPSSVPVFRIMKKFDVRSDTPEKRIVMTSY
jgi:hypothetical protein